MDLKKAQELVQRWAYETDANITIPQAFALTLAISKATIKTKKTKAEREAEQHRLKLAQIPLRESDPPELFLDKLKHHFPDGQAAIFLTVLDDHVREPNDGVQYKIRAIKELRCLTGFGLKDAKEMVEKLCPYLRAHRNPPPTY